MMNGWSSALQPVIGKVVFIEKVSSEWTFGIAHGAEVTRTWRARVEAGASCASCKSTCAG